MDAQTGSPYVELDKEQYGPQGFVAQVNGCPLRYQHHQDVEVSSLATGSPDSEDSEEAEESDEYDDSDDGEESDAESANQDPAHNHDFPTSTSSPSTLSPCPSSPSQPSTLPTLKHWWSSVHALYTSISRTHAGILSFAAHLNIDLTTPYVSPFRCIHSPHSLPSFADDCTEIINGYIARRDELEDTLDLTVLSLKEIMTKRFGMKEAWDSRGRCVDEEGKRAVDQLPLLEERWERLKGDLERLVGWWSDVVG